MRYKFYYNGNDITNDVEIGVTVTERLSELLDIGSMSVIYSTEKEPFEMFGMVNIEIYNQDDEVSKDDDPIKTYDLYIVKDEVLPATKDTRVNEETGEVQARFYNHEIQLMELTHALDYSVVNMLSFTQPIIQETDAPFTHELTTETTDRWFYEDDVDIVPASVTKKEKTFIYNDDFNTDNVRYAQMVEPMERINIPNVWHSDNLKISKKDLVTAYSNVDLKVGMSLYRKYTGNFELGENERVEDVAIEEIEGSHETKISDLGMEYEFTSRPKVTLYKISDTGSRIFVENKTLDKDIEFTSLDDGNYELEYYVDYEIPTPISVYRLLEEDQTITPDELYITNYVNVERKYTYHFTVSIFNRYTMYDFVKRVVNTTPLTTRDRLEGYELFNINPELERRMRNIYIPQLFLEKMTVRKALNVGFAYMNAVVRLEKDGDKLSLNANFLNELEGPAFDFDIRDTYNFEKEQNTSDYSTSNRSFMDNTINTHGTDKPSVVEYGENTYKGLRSDSVHILPDESKLKLDYPIYRLLKITAKVPVELTYFNMTERPSTYNGKPADYVAKTKDELPTEDVDDNELAYTSNDDKYYQFDKVYGNGWEETDIDMHGTLFRTEYIDVDITPRVIEENIYNVKQVANDVFGGTFDEELLSTTGEFFRNLRLENVTYKYGGKEIDFSGQIGQILPRTKQAIMISASLTEQLQYRMGEKIEVDGVPYFFVADRFYVSDKVIDALTNPDQDDLGVANKAPFIKKPWSKDYDYTKLRTGDRLDISNIVSSNLDFFQNMAFKVKYITVDSEVLDSERYDTDNFKKEAVQTIKQGSQIINFERAGLSAHGLSQRLGVPAIGYSKITTEFDDVENIRQYNQHNQIIIQRENMLHRDYVNANLMASRDFNRLAQYIGVERTYRPYEVPRTDTGLRRNDLYKEYIEYYSKDSDDEKAEEHDYPQVRDKALDTIINTLAINDELPQNPVSVGLVKTDGFEKEFPPNKFKNTEEEDKFDNDKPFALLVPVKSKSTMGVLSFTFGWEHNQIAGDRAVQNMSFENENDSSWLGDIIDFFSGDWVDTLRSEAYGIWRELVRYTDKNGMFNYLHFRLLDEFNQDFEERGLPIWEQSSNLPLVQSQTERYFGNQDDNVLLGTHTENYANAIAVYKDPSERYNLTFQISVTPKNNKSRDNVIFGKKFFDENILVYGEMKDKLYVYRYDEDEPKYRPFDVDKIISSKEEPKESKNPVERTSYGFKLNDSISLSGYDHWAIGDEDENLYFAVNNEDRYIYLERRYSRSDIESLFKSPNIEFINERDYIFISDNVDIVDEQIIDIDDNVSISESYESGYHFMVDQTATMNLKDNVIISDEETISISDAMTTAHTFETDNIIDIEKEATITLNDNVVISDEETISISDIITTTRTFETDDIIDIEKKATITLNDNVVISDEETIDVSDSLSTTQGYDWHYRINTNTTQTLSLTYNIDISDEETINITDSIDIESNVEVAPYANEWDYLGTSGDEDFSETYTYGNSECQSSDGIKSWLDANYPASDYHAGSIMKVEHYANGGSTSCTTYYFEAIK